MSDAAARVWRGPNGVLRRVTNADGIGIADAVAVAAVVIMIILAVIPAILHTTGCNVDG